jgi:RNA recognition motif-containing protein
LDWAGLTTEKSEEKEIAENSSDAGRLQTAEIHFSFVSKQVKQNFIKVDRSHLFVQKKYVITEATIRSIFEEFGPVEDICIKKIEYSKVLRMFIFIDFMRFLFSSLFIEEESAWLWLHSLSINS